MRAVRSELDGELLQAGVERVSLRVHGVELYITTRENTICTYSAISLDDDECFYRPAGRLLVYIVIMMILDDNKNKLSLVESFENVYISSCLVSNLNMSGAAQSLSSSSVFHISYLDIALPGQRTFGLVHQLLVCHPQAR